MHMKKFRNVEVAQQLVKRESDCISSRKGYGEEEHHGSCVRLFQVGKVGKTTGYRTRDPETWFPWSVHRVLRHQGWSGL